jgi:hypothetical protein
MCSQKNSKTVTTKRVAAFFRLESKLVSNAVLRTKNSIKKNTCYNVIFRVQIECSKKGKLSEYLNEQNKNIIATN